MSTDRDERPTVASVNFSGTGADSREDRRQVLAGLLHAESPQVVLCQQVPGEKPDDICRDLQSAVREAGMTVVAVRQASYPDPAGGPGCHTAILVRGSVGLDIVSAGPADVPWSEALLTVAGIPYPVRFYSTWLPDSSKPRQNEYASQLAGRVTALARDGSELAFAAGNWNCLAPADNYTQPQLRRMPERSGWGRAVTTPTQRLRVCGQSSMRRTDIWLARPGSVPGPPCRLGASLPWVGVRAFRGMRHVTGMPARRYRVCGREATAAPGEQQLRRSGVVSARWRSVRSAALNGGADDGRR